MAAAWSRIGRGAQLSLSKSLSRTLYEGGVGGASAAEAASAMRSAAALSRARGQHASSLHSLAGRSAGHLLQPPNRGIVTTPARLHPASSAADFSDAETREHEPVAAPPRKMPSLGPTRPGEKPRVVVLGTGWAACRLLKDVDTRAYDVVCVSPRNHMVFTPLLASTCVGTLEFRSVVEPVSRIQSALATRPGSYFFLASCTGVDTKAHEVYCTAASGDAQLPSDPYQFKIAYDKLVIASGAEPLTFNIKGVQENAIFLREVSHAQEIRRKLLTNLMLAENPGNNTTSVHVHTSLQGKYVDHH
jgi:NADH:ubiquinone reductase (non-electrogenic)